MNDHPLSSSLMKQSLRCCLCANISNFYTVTYTLVLWETTSKSRHFSASFLVSSVFVSIFCITNAYDLTDTVIVSMAQGAIAGMPNGTVFDKTQALHEIEELRKIVRFRDDVIAGRHPKFKVPINVISEVRTQQSENSTSRPSSHPSLATNTIQTSIEKNGSVSTLPYDSKPLEVARVSNGIPSSSASGLASVEKSAINPILLGKSEDLIKAEIQLKRQRLERGLREQVEQRRLAQKASLQTSESLPDFDLSDVLFKALNIVHPSTAVAVEPSVGARSASDSFDENTFYSSQHDTPEPDTSKSPAEEEAGRPVDATLTDIHRVDPYGRDLDSRQDTVMAVAEDSNGFDSDIQEVTCRSQLPAQPSGQIHTNPINAVPGLPLAQYGKDFVDITHGESEAEQVSASQSQQGQASSTSRPDSQNFVDRIAVQNTNNELIEDAFPPSPSVFAHSISPYAPQPARISPLVSKNPIPASQQPFTVGEAAPAQVSALREPAAIVSSPDSSPKGTTPREKKKKKDKKDKKGKKRKSTGKGSAVESPETPYIKPEPQSPSPLAAAPLPRPTKRQRQSLNEGSRDGQGGLNYDEPSHEDMYHQQIPERQQQLQQARPQQTRTRNTEDAYDPSEYDPTSYRRPQLREPPQPSSSLRQSAHQSPQSMYASSLPAYRTRPTRASSVVMLDSLPDDSPRYYREDVRHPRQVNQPISDRHRSRSPLMHDRRGAPLTMAPPPRAAPRRIIVDEYGQQFYAPEPRAASQVISRASVAPSYSGHVDEEVIYERPIRAIPRQLAETWDEDGVVYRRQSPLPQPRRVVTQPEYDPEFRQYRQREYVVRPTAAAPPADEYSHPMEQTTRRQMSHFDPPPSQRSYRASSVHPEALPIPPQFEPTRGYASRLSSVRPERPQRGYAHPSELGRPGSRLGSVVPQQQRREYSVRPEVQEFISRDHVPLQQNIADVNYGGPPRQVIRRVIQQPDGEIEYLDRPSQQQQVFYGEPPREVIYR